MGKRKHRGKRGKGKNRKTWMHPRLWIILHAPPRPDDDVMWCDVCDAWKRKTYRVPPTFNDAGLVAAPSYRLCDGCARTNWEGNGAEFLRWTTERKAYEEAYLATITDDEVERTIDGFLAELRQRIRVDGFRLGHAPTGIFRDKFTDVLVVEAMEELLIERLAKAHLSTNTAAREPSTASVAAQSAAA